MYDQKTWWYFFIYTLGRIYSLLGVFCIKSPYSNHPGPHKVLIIYSKFHFDPTEDSPVRLFSKTSTANLARHIYASFAGDEIIYKDIHDPIVDIKDADIVIGIISKAYIAYCKKNSKAKKILFFVNSHPLFRLKVLREEALKNNVDIPRHEYDSPFLGMRCLKNAHEAVMIGNKTVLDTFSKYGAFGAKLHVINSGVNLNLLVPNETQLPKDRIRILYLATNLDLRKGIFRLINIWNAFSTDEMKEKVELVVIGRNDYFTEEISHFIQKHSNVRLIPWIDSTKMEFVEFLQSAHIVLGLSLEEGQVGAIVETMSTGAVPIITKECGIQIQDKVDGFLLDEYTDEKVIEILRDLILHPETIEAIRKSTRKYILAHHTWEPFVQKIREAAL